MEDVTDQSTGTIREIATMVFKDYRFDDPQFHICKCKNNCRRDGSFYLMIPTDKCPKKVVHMKLFYPSFTEISCCECSNFDQVRQSVMKELQIKIWHMETASTQGLKVFVYTFQYRYLYISICYTYILVY